MSTVASLESSDQPIVVIGAGFAGLAAADALVAAGCEVLVLEARGRVGGRVHSGRLQNGALVELGGEFITGGYAVTESLAARFSIPVDGMGIRYPDRELDPDPGLVPGVLTAAASAVAEAALADPLTPARDVLNRAVRNEVARKVLEMRLQSALAYPIADLDGRFALKAPDLVQARETRRLRGGNQRLAVELAAGLGDRVLLDCPVREVHEEPTGLRLIADSNEFRARACIVAIPIALLPDLRFEPALPEATVGAISAIPTSAAAKLAVPLREAVDPRALMSAADRFWAWTTGCDQVGARSVAAWAGATPVLERLGVGAGPEQWLHRLGQLWPQLELDPAEARLTVWQHDPWARGAYSVLPPVANAAGRAVSASPAANLIFAGEHTAEPGWTGTMEGALRSGLRAAEELLRGGGA